MCQNVQSVLSRCCPFRPRKIPLPNLLPPYCRSKLDICIVCLQVWFVVLTQAGLIKSRTTQQAALLTALAKHLITIFRCPFSHLWLTLSCFSLLPKKQPAPIFFPHLSQICCITLPGLYFWNHCWCAHGLAWNLCYSSCALLTLHDCTHEKVLSGPLQLSVKSAQWLYDCLPAACEIQPFFTALSIQLISFSLCNLSIVSHLRCMDSFSMSCSVDLTPGGSSLVAFPSPNTNSIILSYCCWCTAAQREMRK